MALKMLKSILSGKRTGVYLLVTSFKESAQLIFFTIQVIFAAVHTLLWVLKCLWCSHMLVHVIQVCLPQGHAPSSLLLCIRRTYHTHGAPETPARAVRKTWHALLCWNANKCFPHCNFSICCHFNDTHPFLSIPAAISMFRVIKRIISQKEKYTHWETLKIILPDMNYSQSLLIFQFSICKIAEKYRCAR